MKQRVLMLVAAFLVAASCCVAWAADPGLTLEHWAYTAVRELQTAGLLPEYPAEWVASGHSLTRHEFAFYIRATILRLGQREDGDRVPSLATPAELALGRLVAEFTSELRALGVNVELWSGPGDGPVFIDLDNLLAAIGHRPEVPPVNGPPGPHEQGNGPPLDGMLSNPVNLTADHTYRPIQAESFSIPLSDFGYRSDNLISLAGEVLGVEWTIGLQSSPYQEVLGMPLRVGGFVITDEKTGIRGGIGLRLGEQLGIGFDALWFLDLDQAQIAMNRLLLDVNTKVELSERLGFFGGLSLDYRPNANPDDWIGSQASAGVRVLLGNDTYFIAEYSLANPFRDSHPHRQGTTVGLSLGDMGLILLGLQTMSFSNPDTLELTGQFIYRF